MGAVETVWHDMLSAHGPIFGTLIIVAAVLLGCSRSNDGLNADVRQALRTGLSSRSSSQPVEPSMATILASWTGSVVKKSPHLIGFASSSDVGG